MMLVTIILSFVGVLSKPSCLFFVVILSWQFIVPYEMGIRQQLTFDLERPVPFDAGSGDFHDLCEN